MLYKILPRTLFGILMLVIALVLLFYAIITGTLSFKDAQQQQKAMMIMQIEHAVLAKNPEATPPPHLKPALPHMRKMLKSVNKTISKNYQLFYDPDNHNAYWLRDEQGLWIPIGIEHPSLLWVQHFGARILLILILIALSAFILSRMIKKPLERLTLGLLNFKKNREINLQMPGGPKELKDVFTTVKQMMTEINEFDAQRQLVLAGVAHDICTPLARIRVALEMLPQLDPQKKQALINDIEQINYLQEQFLRYTAVKQPHALQSIDLAGLLESCAEQYPQNTIDLQLPAHSLLIKANPRQLHRAFDNVLANALQHGAAPIRIVMEEQNQEVMISITDSGKGVPDELLSKITQPLYRTQTARSNCEGTGLGLAIFVEVIHALKGRVELSNAQPHGLQVKVFLPVEG